LHRSELQQHVLGGDDASPNKRIYCGPYNPYPLEYNALVPSTLVSVGNHVWEHKMQRWLLFAATARVQVSVRHFSLVRKDITSIARTSTPNLSANSVRVVIGCNRKLRKDMVLKVVVKYLLATRDVCMTKTSIENIDRCIH
jgi:hypothetical protein